MKRICITGPESSGKTTLSAFLAGCFGSLRIEEVARSFLVQLGRPYREEDLLEIAREQRRMEVQAEQQHPAGDNPGFYFADTGLEVIKIWSEVRFGRSHPWIGTTLEQFPADLYLLCAPDLPWSPDPLRESPSQEEREMLFQWYRKELDRLGAAWRVVKGTGDNRFLYAQSLVADFLKVNF